MIQQANALPPGYRLEDYLIDGVLGTGGFGVTYKARDLQLDTVVAVKEYFPQDWCYRARDGIGVCLLLEAGQQGGEPGGCDFAWGLRRFLDEARCLAHIRHPQVVGVRRYFRANGTAYIVMDYEEGETLSACLERNGTLDEAALRPLLRDILQALQAVHDQDYLHRDLKPGNIYLRARDGRAALMDFGSARKVPARAGQDITCLITPGYSPPEQYTAHGELYGNWSDLYALGAVAYRCITGQPPQSAAERLLEDRLVPASQCAAGRYSRRLLAVVDRALALRPEGRYASATRMLEDLSRSRVLPVPLGAAGSTPLWRETGGQRHWLGVGLGLTALAVTLGAASYQGLFTEPALSPRYTLEPVHSPESPPAVTLPAPVIRESVSVEAEPPTAEPESIAQPDEPPPDPKPPGSGAEVRRLLALAETGLEDYRLTTPWEDSAFYYYRQVLALEPDNTAARRGLQEIGTRYVWLARQQLEERRPGLARRYVQRGLGVTPAHGGLQALRRRLERRERGGMYRLLSDARIPAGARLPGTDLFNRDSR